MTDRSWLALDIGGANLKAAHSSGQARSLPFELWKRPDELARSLGSLASTLPEADRVALTMTAELCDCYSTKAVGVRSVLDAASSAFPTAPMVVWGVDGRFHEIDEIRKAPSLAAASNWLALATLASRLIPEGPGLLIDIGSTTADLIPMVDGRVDVRGRTDTERLQTGELVYAGVRRTPLCSIAPELPFRGRPTGLTAELFATTLDVYLTLGEVRSDPKDLSPADGRPATADAALDRLARMVGADRDGFTAEDAFAFALAADKVLVDRLVRAARRACSETVESPMHAVVAGSGEFLARRVASRALEPGGKVVSLAEAWGPVASSAACAHALAELAVEWDESRFRLSRAHRRRQGRRQPARLAGSARSPFRLRGKPQAGSPGPGRRRWPVCRRPPPHRLHPRSGRSPLARPGFARPRPDSPGNGGPCPRPGSGRRPRRPP